MTSLDVDNNELLAFLYLMPVAVVGIAADGDIKMLTPRAAALITPLSRDGDFSNLFSILDPITPEVRELIHGYEGTCGVICNHLTVPVAANTVGRHTMVFDINIHKIDADNLMVMFTDITNVTHLEEELLHRTAILDSLPESICVINAEGVIVTINRAWKNYTRENNGIESRCGIGANYFSVFQPTENQVEASINDYATSIKAVLRGTLPGFVSEYDCHSPSGDCGWFSCRANPFFIDGESYAVISHENITLRKRAENNLRKMSRAVEQSPVTIMITDTEGTIEFVNPKFTELTGYSVEEVIGQKSSIFKTDLTPPETFEKMWATITTGKIWEGEFINKRKDGSIFYEHATISALYDGNGAITQYVAVEEDLTEKKSIMAQLIHSQKMESIGELAGGLAHDLNNILSVVNGYAALARHEIGKDQKAYTYIDEITRASSRAASLTHSLLAYSRKQVMNQRNQNLNLLIKTVSSFIARIIHDNIIFTLSLQDAPLGVNVDTVQIEQVLLNLATNARDAMPNGGAFTIATETGCIDAQFITTHGYGEPGRYAIITATDTGTGIDARTKARVFDPFFTTKEIGKGTGLGLAMVMGIIAQHGGFIDLQSEPGSGSSFRLYLPLVNEVPAAPAAQAEDKIGKASGTILIAEDDECSRLMLEGLLVRAGYRVIAAVDGQDAVEKFAAHKEEIDLVISDVVMPRKSGKSASNEIRGMSENVKYIFVSGHSNDVIEREGELGTADEIVSKPILPFELLKKINRLLAPDRSETVHQV